MMHRYRPLVGLSALSLAFVLAGCGSYAPPSKGSGGTASGGQPPAGGMPPSGGSDVGGGGAGGSSQAGTGGSGGSGGQTGGSGGGGGSGGVVMVGELPCPEPVPTDTTCGGDLTGTWAATSCPMTVTGVVDMMGLGLGCQTADITSGSLEIVETWTAMPDGSFADNTKLTGMQELELGPSCLTVSGFVTTCARVSDPFADTLGYDSVECVDNMETGGCTCQATIDQVGGLARVHRFPPTEGTYALDGSTLTTKYEDNEGEYTYCVAGDTLAVSLVTVSRTGTVMGPIVLKKQ